jgi:hypothetical protein
MAQRPASIDEHLDCCFYCVVDAKHFIGAVALLNSLVLTGHRAPVVLLDVGLTPRQRALLQHAATVLQPPRGIQAAKFSKWVAPLKVPAEVMVLLDADVIVVSPLTELIESARAGNIVAFVDLHPDRFFKHAWSETVGVDIPEPTLYVNSGFVALSGDRGRALLTEVAGLLNTVDLSTALQIGDGGSEADPFYRADQDVFNALFAARARDRLQILERELAPARPFAGLRLIDPHTLECRYEDGRTPFLLHHWGGEPWLYRTRPSVYTSLLPRLLTANDLTIRVPSSQLPRWLRGPGARAIDRHVYAQAARARSWARRRGILRGNDTPPGERVVYERWRSRRNA